jgi:hypothetical protein
MLDLDQADTARQLAGKVGTERDVEAEDSRRAASAGTPIPAWRSDLGCSPAGPPWIPRSGIAGRERSVPAVRVVSEPVSGRAACGSRTAPAIT